MELPFPHQKGYSLKKVCTWGIGGPARYFAIVSHYKQLQEMLSFAYHVHLPVIILGKGSNCLFDDRGFSGLVIQNRICHLWHQDSLFFVGSGYHFSRLGMLTARQGWTGLEFASGIPGTVGGAIYMNAGTHQAETADVLKEVKYITEKGELICFKKEDLSFSYRSSSFQKSKGAIVEGVFSLSSSSAAQKQQETLLKHRIKTQPYNKKSAGCVFRNPPGNSAGKLLEESGLKGFTIGGASISSQHANFFINAKNARAKDILALVHTAQQSVFKKTGIFLKTEIQFIPYEGG